MIHRGGNTRPRIPHWFWAALGYTISIGCLIWVYHGFDWKSELPKFARVPWYWLLFAVAADISVYVTQGWRWNLLLRPMARLPVWRTIQAVYIGLFANEVLPLRTGEVIRVYLQSRWSGLPFSIVFSSALIERLFDGIILIIGFYITSYHVAMPGFMSKGSDILAIFLLALVVGLAIVIFSKGIAHHAVAQSRWAEKLWHVVEALYYMGNSRTFYISFTVSVLYLVLQILPIWALLKGYGIDLGFWPAAVVLVILRLGTVIPQAPGNVGSFQFFTVVALSLFAVDRDTAVGFATLLFLVVTVPLWLAGFVALIATRMRLEDIHRDARLEKKAVGLEGSVQTTDI
jgi:uncharacterized membrane protein YbhN (UPF0104 family)